MRRAYRSRNIAQRETLHFEPVSARQMPLNTGAFKGFLKESGEILRSILQPELERFMQNKPCFPWADAIVRLFRAWFKLQCLPREELERALREGFDVSGTHGLMPRGEFGEQFRG
jgi:hypothetical protein